MDEKTWLDTQIDQLNWLRNLKSKAATSDSARYYAVTITELEKVIAYFETWILSGSESKYGGIE